MVSDIDQFGRDTTKNNNPSFNEEKSKKILDSLAEIKNQLENKDYNPNVDDSSPRIRVSNLKNKSDFDELKLKIESLEKKINTIDTFLNNKSSIKEASLILDLLFRNVSMVLIFFSKDSIFNFSSSKSDLFFKLLTLILGDESSTFGL